MAVKLMRLSLVAVLTLALSGCIVKPVRTCTGHPVVCAGLVAGGLFLLGEAGVFDGFRD